MNKYLKFLTFSIVILGGGKTLNNCYSMDEINPQASSSINSSIINNNKIINSNNQINQININNKENILEKKIKLAEVKELVQSFSTNPSDNNFNLDLFQKEHEKQVDVINLLPQLLSKSIEQYNYNNCYMHNCNQNDLLNDLIQDWMGDIKHCNNNEEFIQKITERFNNNYNNIKDDLEELGIVIDVNKIKNLDIINNNKNKEILKAISDVNYRFLMESFLDYKLFALCFDKDKPVNEYINAINVLDRYYDDSIINKSNYKLILKTILHNLIKNICNIKNKFTNCEDCEAETLHFINLLLDSKNNDKYLLQNEGYMLPDADLSYLIERVIKKLAKVEYNNKKDEEEIKRISKLILNETIMPSVKRFMFKDYLSKRLSKEGSLFNKQRAQELKNLLVDILPTDQKVINIFNNTFSVSETVNKTINGIYNKNKTMNAFSQKMGKNVDKNLPEGKSLTSNQIVRDKKINSPYIVDKINSYTRNNMAFNVAKHTKYQ